MAVHWCGTGLSAIPGLKKLILDGNNVIVWNRTVSKARKALEGVEVTIYAVSYTHLTLPTSVIV